MQAHIIRWMRSVFGAALLVALSVLWSDAQQPARAQRPVRPNIVLVLADDLDDAAIDALPRLKALLADQGTTLPNAFASVPLCCPARASLLRGQYAHNHGIVSNSPPEGGFTGFHEKGHENSTVATWLHDAGYRTALLGKYLNRYPEGAGEGPGYVPPGWDEWYAPVGEDAYIQYNYRLNENGRLRSYGRQPEDFLNDVLTAHAERFVRRSVAEGQPFFMYFSSFSPHAPSTPAPRHQQAFPGAQAPRTPSFNEEDVSDKPAHIASQSSLTQSQIAAIDAAYRRRLQSMLALEDTVERLVRTLEETGALANTYIVFTSDHGYHLGTHRLRMGKLTPYEEDIRVRMIVRGPGVPAGRVAEQMAGNIDLAPTFAAIAGVIPPDFVDGRSLLPLWRGETPATWRQAFFVQGGSGGQGDDEPEHEDEGQRGPGNRGGSTRPGLSIPEFRAIRTNTHTYVEYGTGERELYDHRADPYQLTNLASAADPVLLARLAGWMQALAGCAGAGCHGVEETNSID
jgi:N-acetylglucosamine-6-sulfatase